MSKIIAVDFDGTCVEHCYPNIGQEVPEAVEYLREFVKRDAKLILWTMRSEGCPPYGRDTLGEAVAWFAKWGIKLWGVNDNPDQKSWTQSRKVYAHIYIDDAAACTPLREVTRGGRPAVDWSIVGPWVLSQLGDWNEAESIKS